MHVRNGLAFLEMQLYTVDEWDKLHVKMTADTDWNPSISDGDLPLNANEEFFGASCYDNGRNFVQFGHYHKWPIVSSIEV